MVLAMTSIFFSSYILLMVGLSCISAVTSLSVHPSGKLALSVGYDAALRTWNLVKGRQAYTTNLGK